MFTVSYFATLGKKEKKNTICFDLKYSLGLINTIKHSYTCTATNLHLKAK